MDWLWKAGATALAVAAVLVLARYAGRRVAGTAASLPLVTAPTLAWIVHEHGAALAASAAIASVSACAVLAAFALTQARLAHRGGAGIAVVGALLAAAPVAGPAVFVGDCLTAACALGLAGCGLGFMLFPRRIAGTERRMLASSVLTTAVLAGALSALVAAASPQLGAVWAGLLASLPVISAPVAAMAHAAGARDDATEFLHGYIAGLPGRVAFGAAFAAAAVHLGALAAFALAGLAVVVVNAGVARLVLRLGVR